VAEGAGFEVTKILEEPEAANGVLKITEGAVADIGGGTTGLALFHQGRMIKTVDEPTGGDHLSLVLAGHYHISFEEGEILKQMRGNRMKFFRWSVLFWRKWLPSSAATARDIP
jgi:ethanolamine utilization protein EutJ